MDKAQPTRRSALGILATGPIAMLPILGVLQCSAKAEAATTASWDRAVATYESALVARDAIDSEVSALSAAHALSEGTPSGDAALQRVLEAEHRAMPHGDAVLEALMELFDVPSPSFAALAYKLEALDAELSEVIVWSDVAWIKADVLRLSNMEAPHA